jgi:hypothetical protein
LEIEPGQQQRHIPIRFGAPHQQEFPSVSRGQANVQQLQGGQLLEDDAGHQATGQRLEALAQGDREAIRQERHEEVSFDPVGFVMVNGPQAQVAFQGAEGFLHMKGSKQTVISIDDSCRFGNGSPNMVRRGPAIAKPYYAGNVARIVVPRPIWDLMRMLPWCVSMIRPTMANPAQIKQYSGLKYAADKSDAYFLAELRRLDILPTGHTTSAKLRFNPSSPGVLYDTVLAGNRTTL